MSERKELPVGMWFFARVEPNTTASEVQEFLLENGIHLPLNRIAVNEPERGYLHAGAVLSVPKQEITTLMQGYIQPDRMLNGRAFVLTIPKSQYQ